MDYGTCQICGTVKAVTKNGRIARPHTRQEVRGNLILTLQCRGAGRPSAEAQEKHDQWWEERENKRLEEAREQARASHE